MPRKKFPISILIVDDEPAIVEQLAMIISRRVETVFTASNGAQGYECYKHQSPDMIISDIDMPVMNGIEFLKRVRADDHHIPFILSTALKSLDILIEAIEHGITAFLPKPLQMQGLISKLEEVAHTKELEREVKNSTALLDQYKKIVDDSIIVSKADINGIITYVNDTFCSVSGYNREELIGQPHNIVRDPSMPASLFKDVWETIQAKHIWHGIIHNKAKNGSFYTVKSTIAPILDNERNIVEYIALREDVTELYRAQEEARKAAKIKGDFLANMSHEIRTPMNGILGFTDLLSRSSLNEQQNRYLGIIRNSTQTLLGIVNDVLDFSKIESGKFELDFTQINPFVEFKNTAALFMRMMAEKKIVFDVLIDPSLPIAISIDLLRVQQVISNLLSNAVKFTSEQGHISFYVMPQDETHIRIGVKDNGIGIALLQQEKIFEAFSQADSSTTRQYGGTGLGLSISSNLVSLMGGVLKVESQEGIGSHFYFDLTVDKNEKSVQTIAQMDQMSMQKFVGNVLVAEDNDVNQVLIEEYLRQYQLDFRIVNHGQEALDELQKNIYDLLLMDINMPIMSGIDAIAIMKERGISIPVIALTANAMEGDEKRFLEYGFDGYLSKPINLKKLEKILESYLVSRQQKEETFKPTNPSEKPLSQTILNMELLVKELDLPVKIIHKLIAAFLSSSDNNLEELKASIEEDDFKKIEHAAHKIKGSAGNMRFYPIAELAGEIEMLAGSETTADYQTLYHRFEHLIQRVQQEIAEILDRIPKESV
ncbi:MAG TPA: response regulator [Sulfuricurvum sp.]|nr:response regulator [Sulfuricurvum sp.]